MAILIKIGFLVARLFVHTISMVSGQNRLNAFNTCMFTGKNLALVLFLFFFLSDTLRADIYSDPSPQRFYVSNTQGSDYNTGSIEYPFRTLEKALQVVDIRVNNGFYSDKIFLRKGEYKQLSTETIYRLNLKGTSEDRAVLSAMPCEPNTAGAVRMKSGKWYEKVVFDDSWEIETLWTRVPGSANLWQTDPGFYLNEWPIDKMRWRYNGTKMPDDLGKVELHTLAPYMTLQDGEPLLWANNYNEIAKPGFRTYDFRTNTLYVWPIGDKDPNLCKMESWYGGPDKNGYLLRDGEGRALFHGNLEFADICGFEFNMFTRIFEFDRRGYVSENDRVIQRNVRFQDNVSRYCFISILLDSNTTLFETRNDGLIPPHYNDRSNWEVRYNVFYRPVKECFQVHGDNNIFEYNEIIEHAGPWSGPASRVGAVNARNMKNARIRYNYILGNGPNPDSGGSVFMIEASAANHSDENGDYIFGEVCFEYNLFANITSGTAIYAGKGGVRMRNITIRNNVFLSSGKDPAIRISSPHLNLIIENNVFYDQVNPIKVDIPENSKMKFDSLPSIISIRNNIFALNKNTIDKKILLAHKNSKINIGKNLFYKNDEQGLGNPLIISNPSFVDPENFDFRFKDMSSPAGMGTGIGIYDKEGIVVSSADWARIREVQKSSFPESK